MRQTITTATLVSVIVAAIAPGSALAVATTTPPTLGDTIFFVKLLDNPTIIGIVGVLLVEDVVAMTPTFIALGVVPVTLLVIRLRREGRCLLALGVLGLRLRGKSLPSSALAHRSAISKTLTTEVSSSFTDSFSLILMSETPVENMEMTSSLEILGILFLIWLKRWMY
jgi:hypothetical protein